MKLFTYLVGLLLIAVLIVIMLLTYHFFASKTKVPTNEIPIPELIEIPNMDYNEYKGGKG